MLLALLESTKYLEFFLCFHKLFCSDFYLLYWVLVLLSLIWKMGHFKSPRAYRNGEQNVSYIPNFAVNHHLFSHRYISSLCPGHLHGLTHTAHSQPGPRPKGQLTVATRQHTIGGCFTRTLTRQGLPPWGCTISCLYVTGSSTSPFLWHHREVWLPES